MGDMTKNFSRSEFDCPCGCGKNNINPTVAEYCQIIRDACQKPETISCGSRCQAYNDRLQNSVKNSSHISGLAADIYVDGFSNYSLGSVIKQLYKAGKLPKLEYCYIIKNSKRAIHFDIDHSKATKRWRKFAF